MRIQYLGNSGFCIRDDQDLIIVDCYNPEHHKYLEPEIAAAEHVTVLVSHSHRDHYSPSVRMWRRLGNVQLVFSDDIPPASGVIPIHSGESLCVNHLEIYAFDSTDAGVSFLIVRKGKRLFHAGDLNYWHWQEESSPEEIEEAQEAFLLALAQLGDGVLESDVAFFPADPRMGCDYYRGAVQFVQAMRPKVFIPMHYGAVFAPPPAFLEEIKPYTQIFAHDRITDIIELP